ncbi:MAG: mechanosensitive ion channel domain-containing protein [Haloferacaceae archaeon]
MDAVGDLLEMFASLPLRIWVAAGVLAAGIVFGIAAGRLARRLLERMGVPKLVEGTAFERTAGDFGTSTVAIVGALTAYFVLGVAVLAALSVVQIGIADRFWNEVTGFLPQLFVAAFVLLVGLLIGDKVELAIDDRLSGVKLPQAGIVPTVAKYSVVFVATLVALAQVGVAVLALVVLLAAYVFALVVLSTVAFRPLLTSAAAGIYLLLTEPYGIGDEVRVAGHRGVVQDIDLFVTEVEADGEVFIVPNAKAFSEGVVRIRE